MTTAQHELVLYSRDEHVVTITLNRSEKRNAFNAELVKELRAALLRFEADDDAFVAVLTGSGSCFSSGADVGERQIRSVAEFDRLGGPQEPDAHTADLLARLPKSKPIVAAVHGVVMGLGIGVAFECDLVVADSQTRFQITETPRGLGGARFWALLHFCGGGSFATEVALTGRSFFGCGSGRGGNRRFYCSARYGRRDSYSSRPPDRSQSASKRASNRTSTPLVHGSS